MRFMALGCGKSVVDCGIIGSIKTICLGTAGNSPRRDTEGVTSVLNQSTFLFDSPQDAALEDFFARVDRSGGPKACWPWIGRSFTGSGYGQIMRGGRRYSTHQYSYLLHYGHLPEGRDICHRCDNPACVNPGHLFAATHLENVLDRERKGRGNTHKGSHGHFTSKLSDDDVRAIRVLYGQGWTQSAIGAQFGVTQIAISLIVRGINRSKVK